MSAKPKPWAGPSLTEVLASLGMTHEPGGFQARRVLKDGVEMFVGSSSDTWTWLRNEGEIRETCRECSRSHVKVELDLAGVCEDCDGELARAADRERRIAEYESSGDYLRDMQKDEPMSRRDADYYASGENWRGE